MRCAVVAPAPKSTTSLGRHDPPFQVAQGWSGTNGYARDGPWDETEQLEN
jgi:hypothetical protein